MHVTFMGTAYQPVQNSIQKNRAPQPKFGRAATLPDTTSGEEPGRRTVLGWFGAGVAGVLGLSGCADPVDPRDPALRMETSGEALDEIQKAVNKRASDLRLDPPEIGTVVFHQRPSAEMSAKDKASPIYDVVLSVKGPRDKSKWSLVTAKIVWFDRSKTEAHSFTYGDTASIGNTPPTRNGTSKVRATLENNGAIKIEWGNVHHQSALCTGINVYKNGMERAGRGRNVSLDIQTI